MEITNEIKAKVFAQYLGQKWISPTQKEPLSKIDCSDLDQIFYVKSKHNGSILVLKPLSAITDEDAIGVGKFFGHITELVDYYRKENSFIIRFGKGEEIHSALTIYFDGHLSLLKNGGSALIRGEKFLQVHQYLQFKGYDLPHYLLGGKTLHESGLAIYE